MTPTVSIALITYNHERWVRDAVAGIRQQDADFPCEIVVADDSSSDATRHILEEELQSAGIPSRFLSADERLGMHDNWMRALNACEGKYIALVEGDDYWSDPRKLSRQVAALEDNPDWSGCHHRVQVVDDREQPLYLLPPSESDFSETTFDDLIAWNRISTVSVIYRNGLVSELPAGFYALKQLDWSLHLLHARQGPLGFLPETMAVYRRHEQGAWNSQSLAEQMTSIFRTWDAFEDYFGSEHSPRIREKRIEQVQHVCGLLAEAENSKDFRLGRALLKPYRFFRNWK